MELNSRFIARQAILDSQSHCFGYELLYRNANQERAAFDDAGQASMQVFDSAYLFGIDALCGESKAFVNCARETLLSDLVNVLQPTRTVLEILGADPLDPELLKACTRLKTSGFMLALDHFVPGEAADAFLPLVDIVKMEIGSASPEAAAFVFDRISPEPNSSPSGLRPERNTRRPAVWASNSFKAFTSASHKSW
jgi:EAL and modified HD-GYP domain-containing signal transduction protein